MYSKLNFKNHNFFKSTCFPVTGQTTAEECAAISGQACLLQVELINDFVNEVQFRCSFKFGQLFLA